MPELRDWSVGNGCCYVWGAPSPSGLSAVGFLAGAESLAVLWVAALVRCHLCGKAGQPASRSLCPKAS